MSQDRRGGGRRSKLGRSGGGIAQLPWQSVKNPYPPMQLLDEERMIIWTTRNSGFVFSFTDWTKHDGPSTGYRFLVLCTLFFVLRR